MSAHMGEEEAVTYARELPWFRVKFADGREVEIHSQKAVEIYDRDYKEMILSQPAVANTSHSLAQAQPEKRPNIIKPQAPKGKGQATKAEERIANDLIPAGVFDQPLSLGEVKNELDRKGFFFDPRAVNRALVRLVRIGRVTRIGQRGEYRYVKA